MTTGPGIAKAPAPPVLVCGVPVTAEFLADVERLAIACAAEGITLQRWHALARAEVAR